MRFLRVGWVGGDIFPMLSFGNSDAAVPHFLRARFDLIIHRHSFLAV
jgi:hypothetical protein